MKILAITNLFPNNLQPDRGVFNRQQFERLNGLCEIKVVAPVPWYPKFLGTKEQKIFPRDVVQHEIIKDMDVFHPRHLVTPKIGRRFYGRWMYWGMRATIHEIYKTYPFDAVLTAWAYPDAYATMLICREMGKPYCVQVHGSDINILAQNPARRKRIIRALEASSAVISVSSPLAQKIQDLGISSNKIHLVFSGVDKKTFFLRDKAECKKRLNLDPQRKHLLFVGNLVPVKGVTFLIKAFASLPENVYLHILGDGELKAALQTQAQSSNAADRIFFHGRRPHAEIPEWMNAADIFCLPSLNEGSPNVILESLACGTPAAASRVGGIPELLSDDNLGLMFPSQNPEALADCLKTALEKSWNYQGIAEYALRFDWDDNARTVHGLLKASITR